MKKLIIALVAGVLMSVTSGCAKQSFVLENNFQQVPQVEDTSHFFIYGIVQEDMNNLSNICPNGVGKIEAYLAPRDIAIQVGISIISVGTLGWIYTPRSWKVYCKS